LTYAAFHDCMEAAGCRVGIAFDGAEHRLEIDDPAGRRVTMTVDGSFDRAARVLVLSGGLRELLGRTGAPPPAPGARSSVSGAWPELLELARAST